MKNSVSLVSMAVLSKRRRHKAVKEHLCQCQTIHVYSDVKKLSNIFNALNNKVKIRIE